jgi:hypothetical protein
LIFKFVRSARLRDRIQQPMVTSGPNTLSSFIP